MKLLTRQSELLRADKRLLLNKLTVGAIALAIATLLSACLKTQNPSTKGKIDEVTTVEVGENTESLIGQSVSVRNDIQTVVSKRAFILDEDQVFGGTEILVIDRSDPQSLDLKIGIEVLVIGKVEQFVKADLEPYTLDLDPDLYARYKNKPVIIARSVILSPDPGDVTNNPESYYNRTIAIAGEVEDVRNNNIFELDEEQLFGGEDLLVIKAQPEIEAQDDQNITVIGVLRPFDLAALEQDYDLNWGRSLREQLEAEYANKPVLVAQEVYLNE